jgi:hypothetical protein
VEHLEDRLSPAITNLGGGLLQFPGRAVWAFPDFIDGEVEHLEAGDLVYVGAKAPGGPRVAVFDLAGNRVRPDYFADDPATRVGVKLVGISLAEHREHLAYGDPADPGTFTVFVDWDSRKFPSAADERRAMDEMWSFFGPLGNVALVNDRPDEYPARFGTVTVGQPLTHYTDPTTGQGPVGLGTADWDQPWFHLWISQEVLVDSDSEHVATPEDLGRLMAHEASHGFGWEHEDGESNRLEIVRAGAADAARLNQ